MKHVKLFEKWEEENLPEAEDLMDRGEEAGEEAEETGETPEAEDAPEDSEKEGYVGDLMLSWETVKGDVLDKYRDGAITKEEAMSLLG